MPRGDVLVSVHILDREYRIACAEGQQETLHEAARFLNEQMRLTRDGGIIGNERVVVMTALNLAGDLLACRGESVDYSARVNEILLRMQGKLNAVSLPTDTLE